MCVCIGVYVYMCMHISDPILCMSILLYGIGYVIVYNVLRRIDGCLMSIVFRYICLCMLLWQALVSIGKVVQHRYLIV